MKAAIVPSVNSKWEVRETKTPEPGENQVLIKIRASGMCYTDVHQARGEFPGDFPRTLGHEPVGEIVALGPGVTARQKGDRVGVPWIQHTCGRCEWCARGKPSFCEKSIGTGVQISGGHAEYMVAYADATMLLPEGLDYEQAAPLFCAGYTVWSGLRWADPQPGECFAVVGIGGLGHLAVQFAKAAGFRTIAISHSTDKDKFIRELGADEIVRDGKGLAKVGGADVILGTSNSVDAMADSITGLRPDGRLVLMGIENKPLPVHPADLIARRLRILGSQQNDREYLYEALQIAASGKVKVLTETYSLDEVTKAYDRVADGKVRFRAVITTGD
ncbi:MAG: alcohol dehydrogenase catalytic domain-containing protein [Verrucomicrobia bacterium]|nr:alcohol dehydrogenase catalytic domain-containing protein [Verrucomicrobiota bacterium]